MRTWAVQPCRTGQNTISLDDVHCALTGCEGFVYDTQEQSGVTNMDMMKLRLTIEIASRCLNQLEAALDRNDHSAAETALRRVDRELDTLIAGVLLKFFW